MAAVAEAAAALGGEPSWLVRCSGAVSPGEGSLLLWPLPLPGDRSDVARRGETAAAALVWGSDAERLTAGLAMAASMALQEEDGGGADAAVLEALAAAGPWEAVE